MPMNPRDPKTQAIMVSSFPIPPLVPLPRAVSEGDEIELEDRAIEDDGGRVFDDRSEVVVGDGLAGDDVFCRSFNGELENSGVGESVEDELERFWRAELKRDST